MVCTSCGLQFIARRGKGRPRTRCDDCRPKVPLDDSKWKRLRRRVLADEPRCYVCGSTSTEVDHVQPVSLRPDLRLERSNLKGICGPCNKRKGARGLRVPLRPPCPECGSSLGPNEPGRSTHWCLPSKSEASSFF